MCAALQIITGNSPCDCVIVLYHLVVRAASVDGCLCLSGSLPLIFLYACAYFEANKYDDDLSFGTLEMSLLCDRRRELCESLFRP